MFTAELERLIALVTDRPWCVCNHLSDGAWALTTKEHKIVADFFILDENDPADESLPIDVQSKNVQLVALLANNAQSILRLAKAAEAYMAADVEAERQFNAGEPWENLIAGRDKLKAELFAAIEGMGK